MLALWIFLAYWFTSHRLIAKVFLKYGQILNPFILIFLGVYILVTMGTINLFIK
jgi:cadmium resistance protein CadD (predicted permease)